MPGRKRHGIRQQTVRTVPRPFVSSFVERAGVALQYPAGSSPKNIVVFGESGIGKSSLINQISGQSIVATSNSAKGCTFQHQKYEFKFDDGTPYAIWDTSGLDEGTQGTVPAKIAEKNLKHLLRDLSRASGLHLLVHCIRGTRLCRTSLRDYNLFYSAICRKKVPIVAVVTGLENYGEDMEDWWTANQSEFAKLKMHFDGHACVTTLNADEEDLPILKQRCYASRQAVLDVIASACARDRWGTDSDGWVSAALADVHAVFRPSRQKSHSPPTPVVAMCDLLKCPFRSGSQDVSPPPFEGGQLMDVVGSPLLVYRIRDSQLSAGTRFKDQVASRGADLLIFCTSLHAENTDAARRCAEEFYRSYGGDMRPLLVVVQDAPSDEVASQWWNTLGDDREKDNVYGPGDMRHPTQHPQVQRPDAGRVQAIVRALPPLENASAREAVVRLQGVIQTRALQPLDDAPSGCFGWLTGGRRRRPVCLADAAFQPDSLANARVWSPYQRRDTR